MNSDPLQDPDLPELVSAVLERHDRGVDAPLEEICAARPDLLEAVRASVDTSLRMPKLQARMTTADPFVGRTLAERYFLEARLGAGSMGVVYRALDTELGRPVAVKILRSNLWGGREAEQRFLREAEVLAALDHPAVVSVHDRGRTQEQDLFLVMDLIHGQPLSELLDEAHDRGQSTQELKTDWIAAALGVESLTEPSYLRMVAGWVADLADGLQAAHEQGVFHRDVKPSNILIQGEGGAVLLDFGTAARQGSATITREDAALGTPAYMAPESLSPNHRANPRVDVYGLAATLYHLLTLVLPYSGRPTQVLATLATKDPRPASSLCPGLPRDLVAILDRGMARRPEQRYASAQEMADDLRAFLEHRPVSARPLRPWTRAWRRARRSPAMRAVASLLLVAGIAFAGLEIHAREQSMSAARFRDAWQHIPPNLTIGAPTTRVWAEGPEREGILALLKTAADNCDDPIPARSLRAAFLLDQGWAGEAAQEMDILAHEVGSEYARALAGRYRALEPAYVVARGLAPASAEALDLSGLPEPKETSDLYLAAYHSARGGDWPLANTILSDPSLAEHSAARELALRSLIESREDELVLKQTAWLEGQLGQQTATTAYWRGIAYLRQKLYSPALDVFQEGLKLAPTSHRLHENAGLAAWRLWEPENALEHYAAAIAIKPKSVRVAEFPVRILMDLGDLDQAFAALNRVPYQKNEEGRLKRLGLLAEIETEQALALGGESEKARSIAQQAVTHFSAFMQLEKARLPARAAIATELAAGNREQVFAGLLDLIQARPMDPARLKVVLHWIPLQLDIRNTQSVKDYLRALQERLAQKGPQAQSTSERDSR